MDSFIKFGFSINKKILESEGATNFSASAPSKSMESVGLVTTVSPTTSLTGGGRQDPQLSIRKPETRLTWRWTSRRTFLWFRRAPEKGGGARDSHGGTLDPRELQCL